MDARKEKSTAELGRIWVSGLTLACLIFPAPLAVIAQTGMIDFQSPSSLVLGLEPVHNGDGTDGEGDLVTCGPAGDPRDAMKPKGASDDDLADAYLYFKISCCASAPEIALKSAASVTVTAVIYDAPELAKASVGLEYTNRFALDNNDRENVFSRHPFIHTLEGSGSWTSLSWACRNAGFASRQHGAADFRIFGTLPGGGIAPICVDRAQVAVGVPPLSCPSSLSLAADEETGEVSFHWTNNGFYQRLRILRNGRPAAVLPGTASSFEESPGPGRFVYEVVALPPGDSCAGAHLRGEARVFPQVSACGCPNPDADGDGDIDFRDLAMVASNAGLKMADPDFTLAADIDRNQAVDMADIQMVLGHLRELPPPPAVERELHLRQTLGGIGAPGPLVLVKSPYARGSGRPEEDASSLLRHGKLLAISKQASQSRLLEVDPLTGSAVEFPAASKSDLNGDPALAEPTGIDFSGSHVWAANRQLLKNGTLVGSVAALDRRTAAPVSGPTGTGVFAANEDAVDSGPSTGFLEETAGLASGGSGPDGAAGGDNQVTFQTNSRSGFGDGADRSASLTAVDLDTGLYQVASLAPEAGLPGPLAFRPGGGLAALAPPLAVRLEAEAGIVRGAGLRVSADGKRLVTANAGKKDHVLLEVTGLPADGEYAVRLVGFLPGGARGSRVRLEALEAQDALERRLRPGSSPGKLGPEPRAAPLGRLSLLGGAGGNHLILRVPEPGMEIDALEFEGPVGGRLYAAARDPGAVYVYGLGLTGPAGQAGTLYRGILEQVLAVCPFEAGPGSDFLLDPAALEISGAGGSEALFVLDGVRSAVARIPLAGGELEAGIPECFSIPVAGQFLTGLAMGPVGPEGRVGLYVASHSVAGGAGGAPEGGADTGGEGAQAVAATGISVLSGLHTLTIDREASDIVKPLRLLDRRALVVKGEFIDGTVQDVTAQAAITSLDPAVVKLVNASTIEARAAYGLARLRAELEGLVAEAAVGVSPEGFAWRTKVPPAHRVRPLPRPDSAVRIYPDRQSYQEVFGAEVNALLLPEGIAQPFTAVLIDPEGRASGLDIAWSVESAKGNAIAADGTFLANAPEPAALAGFDQVAPGLMVTAEIAGESASEPLSVISAKGFPGAPPRALKIFPRDLRFTPGSQVRFVALLLDGRGMPRSFTPEWVCDGLPMDRETGLLTAEYRGETVDETFAVFCRDPQSGLSDLVPVTVLYSETTGIASLPDAQSLVLAQSLLQGALKDLLQSAMNQVKFRSLMVTEENAGKAVVSGDIDKLSIILGDLIALFKLDYRAEILFVPEQILRMEIDPAAGTAVVAVRLKADEILSSVFKHLRVKVKTNLIQFILSLLGLTSPETEDQASEQKEVTKLELKDLKNSVVEITAHMDLSTGEFSLASASWKTGSGKEVHKYLAEQVANFIGLEKGLLDVLEKKLLRLLNDILLGEGGVVRLAIEFVCEVVNKVVSSVAGPVLGQAAEEACKKGLIALAQQVIKAIVEEIFDQISDAINLKGLLEGPIQEYVSEPALEFLFKLMRDRGLFKKVSEGYEALSLADDLGRIAGLQFAALPLQGAGLALRSSALPGELQELVRVQNKTVQLPTGAFTEVPFAEFRHAGILSYEEENGVLLEGLGSPGPPSGVPFDNQNGLALGAADLGVSTNAADLLSSLFRIAGCGAYKKDGAPRGPVPLQILEARRTASDGAGHTVNFAASTVSAPFFEFLEGAAPGTVSGRAHLLAKVVASGDLDFTVFADVVAPLDIARQGRKVAVTIASQAPGIIAPAAGEAPFANAIRDLLATSPTLGNLRSFVALTLEGQLPITVEYPEKVAVAELGFLNLSLPGNDTDPGFEDDFLKVAFQEDTGAGGEAAGLFIRGDCNGDGQVDRDDIQHLLEALYLGGKPYDCGSACDANGDGAADLTDAIHLFHWLTASRDPPPAPYPFCGWVRDPLSCNGGNHGCP